MHHFGVLQLVLRSGATRQEAWLCASWRHERPLFSKAFWEPERLDEACKDVEQWVCIEAVAPFMQKTDRLRQYRVVAWTESCVRGEGHALGGGVGQKMVCVKNRLFG